MVIVSPASGSLSDRFGPAPFAAIGVGSSLAAFLFISRFDLQTGTMVIILVSALLGFGFGMFGSPNNSTIMGAVPKERTGTTSALIATMRNAGMSLGMALAGTVYSTSMTFHKTELIRQGMDADHAAKLSIPLSFHDSLLVPIVIQAIVTILCLIPVIRRRPAP